MARSVRFNVVMALFLFPGLCSAQSPGEKGAKIMNKQLKAPWEAAKCRVFVQDGEFYTTLDAKKAEYEVEIKKDAKSKETRVTTIPVTAFMTPSGRTWLGASQDFYIETKAGIVGFEQLEGGILWWSKSLTKENSATAGAEWQSKFDALPSTFESSIKGSDLFEAHRGALLNGSTEMMTDLNAEGRIDPVIFMATPGSSEIGLAKISGASLDAGKLKLDLANPTGEYKVTAWVDIKSRKLVDASSRQ